jgi:hypothetical protein
MARAAHRGGEVDLDDVAGDKPVEQVADTLTKPTI